MADAHRPFRSCRAQAGRAPRLRARRTALGLAVLLAACDSGDAQGIANRIVNRVDGRQDVTFPAADRPVAAIVSSRWSTEEARDRVREADTVMDLAGIRAGMTVADIGAGEGYYTIRLAQRVGKDGRVLAQDIVPAVRDALATRVDRERLDTVSVKLGETDDPKLPANSFDRVFMVHMYHEIASPYAFLWHLRPSLKPGGRLIVVDADRETQNHGTPPALLDCEMRAVGYALVERRAIPSAGGYLAAYRAEGSRPEPGAIAPCRVRR